MSIVQTWRTTSTGSSVTLKLAERIGRKLRGGEVIELMSDLGGGKTTFVNGLAKGAGSSDPVHSPSFTLSNEYHAKGLTLHHLDFYRLSEPGIMRDELAETLSDPRAVVAVEWGNIAEDIMPKRRLRVILKVTGDKEREITFEYPDNLAYLIENT